MRKLFKLLTKRLVWYALFILFQFAILVYFILSYSANIYWFSAFIGLSIVLAIFIMTREENPSYKMVWMFIMLVLPMVGSVLYLVFGNKKLGRFAQKKMSRYTALRQEVYIGDIESDNALSQKSPVFARESSYIANASGFGVWQNTKTTYYPIGEDFYEDLLIELKKAKSFIFLEYFIIGKGKMWSSILEILRDKANKGVDVRVVYDDLGSINVLPAFYDVELRKMGIKAMAFNAVRPHMNPRLNYRDHRKILVIDGNTCFTGGLNLSDEYINDEIRFGYWKDNAIKLEGDAVWSMTFMFMSLWNANSNDIFKLSDSKYRPSIKAESDGFVQPFSDSPLDSENVCEYAYMQVINNAERYVWITTPYLILDNEMQTALKLAAKSGVDVRIVTPYYADKKSVHEVTRANYKVLVEAGVKIYEYTPGFLHSKTVIADDEIALVGTANMDYRSFYLHFELGVAFYDSSMVHEVKNDIVGIMNVSEEQTLAKITKISRTRKILRAFLKFFSPAL